MNLYLISQTEDNDYDTYDSAIVCARSEKEARQIHPGGRKWGEAYGWCRSPEAVSVEKIGKADNGVKVGVVLASFNAG